MAVIIIILVLLLIWIIAGLVMFNIACRRRGEMDLARDSHTQGTPMEEYKREIRDGISWIAAQPAVPLHITSHDGLRLAAQLIEYPQPEQARGTVILFHGYRSKARNDFSCSVQLYQQLGYHVLLVDQRAHGQSEGRYICFGVQERRDCLGWVELICHRYGRELPIILGGMSMGATTVLMAAGGPLPDNVCAITADCGFSSPWDIMKKELPLRYHIPYWLMLPIASCWSRLLAGFGFRDYSTLRAMDTNTRPILFIHGTADDFVPPRMSELAYARCRSEKQLLLVPGAAHGLSYLVDEPTCRAALIDFFQRHTPPHTTQN